MKTIRQNTFETNSSSCHVLTIATQAEYDLIKNKQALLYVPRYGSQSEEIYDSEILTKDKYLSLIEKKLGDEFETYSDFVNYVWDNYIFDPHTDFYNLCEEHKIPSDIQIKLDDIIWHCQHEEDPVNLLATAKKKEVNGSIVYVTCWEKYC